MATSPLNGGLHKEGFNNYLSAGFGIVCMAQPECFLKGFKLCSFSIWVWEAPLDRIIPISLVKVQGLGFRARVPHIC